MWVEWWFDTKNHTIEDRIQSFKIKKLSQKGERIYNSNLIFLFIFLILISYLKSSDKIVRPLRFDRLAPEF